MSHGHNRNKGFSQTSKRFDGDIKEQERRQRSTQHSTETTKENTGEKPVRKVSSNNPGPLKR